MALTFLRHTAPEVAKGICYGRTDLTLAASFEAELVEVLKSLPAATTIVSSPLYRCRTLAQRVAQARGAEVQILEGLTEMDFGSWEMVPWSEVPREGLDQWAEDFLGARPHGGENVQMLRDRVSATLASLAEDTLVVTHSGVIRAAAALFDHPEGWEIDIPFGGWVRMG